MEQTVQFVNARLPLADEIDPAAKGLQRFTATVEALVVPDIDTALDEAPAKTAFWNAFKAVGAGTPSCRHIEPEAGGRSRGADGRARALHGRRRPALGGRTLVGPALPHARPLPRDVLALVWLLLPLREHRVMLPAGLALGALAAVLHLAELDVLTNLAKLFALVCVGFGSCRGSRT